MPKAGAVAASKGKKTRKGKTPSLPLPPSRPLVLSSPDKESSSPTPPSSLQPAFSAGRQPVREPSQEGRASTASAEEAAEWTEEDFGQVGPARHGGPEHKMAESSGDGKQQQKMSRKQAKKAAAAAPGLPFQSSSPSSPQHLDGSVVHAHGSVSEYAHEADAQLGSSQRYATLSYSSEPEDLAAQDHHESLETTSKKASRSWDPRITDFLKPGWDASYPSAPALKNAPHQPSLHQDMYDSPGDFSRKGFESHLRHQSPGATAEIDDQQASAFNFGHAGIIQPFSRDDSSRTHGAPPVANLQGNASTGGSSGIASPKPPPARIGDVLTHKMNEFRSLQQNSRGRLLSSPQSAAADVAASSPAQHKQGNKVLTVPRPRQSPVRFGAHEEAQEAAPSGPRDPRREQLFAPKPPLHHQVR